MPDPVLALEAHNVHRRYKLAGHEVHVLRGLSLEVQQGERVFLCGASGSGKTTLLYTLGGLEKPTAGDIYIGGEPFYGDKQSAKSIPGRDRLRYGVYLFIAALVAILAISLSLKQNPAWGSVFWLLCFVAYLGKHSGAAPSRRAGIRNTNIGFVFQNYHLLPDLTAYENVLLPSRIRGKLAQERAVELLKRVGLEERLYHLPTELSGGEQQRVALARSLINDPAIILADEPTGNLDAATGKQIMELLFTVVAETKKTLVVVTHDMNLAERGDRRLVLKEGVLVAA